MLEGLTLIITKPLSGEVNNTDYLLIMALVAASENFVLKVDMLAAGK